MLVNYRSTNQSGQFDSKTLAWCSTQKTMIHPELVVKVVAVGEAVAMMVDVDKDKAVDYLEVVVSPVMVRHT